MLSPSRSASYTNTVDEENLGQGLDRRQEGVSACGGTTHGRNRERLALGLYVAKWSVVPQRCPRLRVTSRRGRRPTPPVPATGGCSISGEYPCGAGDDGRLDRPKPQYSPVDVPSTPRYRRRVFLWGQLQFPGVRRARHTLTRPLVPANAARSAKRSHPPDHTHTAHGGARVVALTRGGRMAPPDHASLARQAPGCHAAGVDSDARSTRRARSFAARNAA